MPMNTSRLCATVTAATTAGLRDARDRASGVADLVELRLDGVRDLDVQGALAGRRRPVIVTCRPVREGGGSTGRRTSGSTSSGGRPRWARSTSTSSGTPRTRRWWRGGVAAASSCRRTTSTACRPTWPARFARDARHRRRGREARRHGARAARQPAAPGAAAAKPRVTAASRSSRWAMPGLPSRVLAARFGSCWTYAGGGVAPGQLTPSACSASSGSGLVTAATRVFGVVGRPSGTRCRRRCTTRRSTRPASTPSTCRSRRGTWRTSGQFADGDRAGGRQRDGAVQARRRCGRLRRGGRPARRCGAANTLLMAGGRWEARNTDVDGFLAPLDARAHLASTAGARGRGDRRRGPGGRRRAGAARRARDRLRARREEAARGRWRPRGRRSGAGRDAERRLVGPAGQRHAGRHVAGRGGRASGARRTGGGRIVYDLVYNPPRTRCSGEAAAAGCVAIGGLDMLVAQAARQFEWWTGRTAPRRRMHAAAGGGSSGCTRRWTGERMKTDDVRGIRGAGRAGHVRAGLQGNHGGPADAGLRLPEDRRALRLRLPARERRGRRTRRPLLVPRQGPVPGAPRGPRRPHDDRAGGRDDGARTSRSCPTLRRLMADFRAPAVPDLPRFTGGRRGVPRLRRASWFEPVPREAAGRGRTDGEPAAGFMLFDTVLAFDHVRHRILIIANARVDAGATTSRRSTSSRARRSASSSGNCRRACRSRRRGRGAAARRCARTSPASSSRRRFAAAQEHIAAGDIYQVVLSQRFDAEVDAEPVHGLPGAAPRQPVALHVLRPHGRAGRSSARRRRCWCASKATRVETHPIAGTRPRGRDEAEDVRLAEELKADEKERAEHVMLVDLGRNDVGRVSEYGSVRVPAVHGARALLARHAPGVGRRGPAGHGLRPARRAGVVLPGRHGLGRAEDPGDGDHRRRSSPTARGIYAGAVGYLDFAGNLDFCIAIRTIVMNGTTARVQAGAGIVMDSDPVGRVRRDVRQGAGADPGAGAGVGGAVADARPGHRQLRLVHLQPRAVPGRAGRRAGRAAATTRSRSTGLPRSAADRIVLSPGPGHPADAGIIVEAVRRFGAQHPDCSASAWGTRRSAWRSAGASCGRRRRCTARRRAVDHDGRGIFAGVASPFEAAATTRWSCRPTRGRSDSSWPAPDARRRPGDGAAAPRLADPRRAVPSRVDSDGPGPADPEELPRTGESTCSTTCSRSWRGAKT